MIRSIVILISLITSFFVFAGNNYYPTSFQKLAISGASQSNKFKNKVFNLLSQPHLKHSNNSPDDLGCSEQKGTDTCYQHLTLSYRNARKFLFGQLHLEKDKRGFYIKDVYCRKIIRKGARPLGIPNHKVMNAEHTWPQSRFSRNFSTGQQKSDLHHLFPTDSRANSIRGAYWFGNVRGGQLHNNNCESSRFGISDTGRMDVFEPPMEHKGNLARAIFYFSTRYQMKISNKHEAVLREWSRRDPVDADERLRNDRVFEIQKNRNPFVDYPKLVDMITDF